MGHTLTRPANVVTFVCLESTSSRLRAEPGEKRKLETASSAARLDDRNPNIFKDHLEERKLKK